MQLMHFLGRSRLRPSRQSGTSVNGTFKEKGFQRVQHTPEQAEQTELVENVTEAVRLNTTSPIEAVG